MNPLVPVGALMTAGLLTAGAGLISFSQVNSQLGQKLMRLVDFATVALMVGTCYYHGEKF
uniref:HIG1 domain-containing protein n=1 Tax=Kalanchoe fedtschenkoi TaxID=63787 RepID=A0A7N0ZT76_KALFE